MSCGSLDASELAAHREFERSVCGVCRTLSMIVCSVLVFIARLIDVPISRGHRLHKLHCPVQHFVSPSDATMILSRSPGMGGMPAGGMGGMGAGGMGGMGMGMNPAMGVPASSQMGNQAGREPGSQTSR